MLTMNNGSPQFDKATTKRMALRTISQNPIECTPGQEKSEKLDTRDFPVESIDCWIQGELDVAGTVTLKDGGLYRFLKFLEVARNGNDTFFRVPGDMLPTLHRLVTNQAPPVRHAGLTAGDSGKFSAYFKLPFDIGGYNSLADFTADQSCDFNIDTAPLSDVMESGTATVSNFKLAMTPKIIEGGEVGKLGGVGANYLKPFYRVSSEPVKQNQVDMTFDLTAGRGYHLLMLVGYKDGERDDSIIKSVKLERADKSHVKLTADEIRDINQVEYELGTGTVPAEMKGVLVVPFVKPGHPEHTQSIAPSQSMKLICEVEKDTGNQEIKLLQGYFRF
ncbi:hypothetical protein [Poriferisphaera sp. WC338]|uniref:hypothetical protein n=1 Tax=Poriferisphaera sp. WC338 TaxID=3425129 RepID=UPI003D815043